ncbi:MAG TPA: hypothetical protein VF397_01745 [Pyrinomonadaceae bacterium]
MKSLTRRLLVLLVLSTVTLFAAPSISANANCTFSLVDSDGTYLGTAAAEVRPVTIVLMLT